MRCTYYIQNANLPPGPSRLQSVQLHKRKSFKLYRNKVNHLLKISKKRYYNQYFLDNITDGKKIWKGIKQIVHFKPNTNQKFVKIMDNNNEEISDPKSIANAFNNHFSNIGKVLDNQIPRGHSNPMDYLHSSVKDSFFYFTFSLPQVGKLKLKYLI